MKKIIEEIANEKRQEKEESLSKKYYQTFLSSMENVTLEQVPLFRNGLFIKDKEGNEILLYDDFFSYSLVIDVTYEDGFNSITKEKFNDKTNQWEVL